MINEPLLSYWFSHQTKPSGEVPRQTLQVFMHRPTTQQSVVDFQVPCMTDDVGNLNGLTTEIIEFMLIYHEIAQQDSNMLIHHTADYLMRVLSTTVGNIDYDLQIILTITDYNPYATAMLDVDFIITDLEGTNRPPTMEEVNETCVVCFENFNYRNYLCSLSCGHKFHFPCIDQWLRRNISCPVCRESNL